SFNCMTKCSSHGRLPTGAIALGSRSVKGRNLVPSPPANNNAFIHDPLHKKKKNDSVFKSSIFLRRVQSEEALAGLTVSTRFSACVSACAENGGLTKLYAEDACPIPKKWLYPKRDPKQQLKRRHANTQFTPSSPFVSTRTK